MTKKPKLISSIRAKLVSAVAMLLVAVIMVVSSTYAWFTLSTAPEVTGITTQIGANGALEMALLPSSGLLTDIKSEVGDAVKDMEKRNTTWGNLVDLSDNSIYGLNLINLYPSALVVNDAGTLNVGSGLLKVPQYGADGRIDQLVANTFTGVYDSTELNFSVGSGYGVRAVGTASGMSDVQLAYRDARSAANTAISQAKTTASQSLNKNGSALANIAIKRATSKTATYNKADIESLEKIVNDLLKEDGSLQHIEKAYEQLFLAFAASKQAQSAGVTEENVTAVKNALETSTLDQILNDYSEISVPATFTTSYEKFKATKANAEAALRNINGIKDYITAQATADVPEDQVPITWEADTEGTNATDKHAGMSATLHLLANPEEMLVNNIKTGDIMTGDNMSKLVNSVASGGLVVTMTSGGGVYADIADQCGDYFAQVQIEEVSYNGLTLNNVNAKMQTDSKETAAFLDVLATAAEGAEAPDPEDAADAASPLTEMYGYIVDMAFRTNAAESNLLLQTNPLDRIYKENKDAAASTMGHGSTMSFKSENVSTFSNEKVVGLMESIRVVFFDPKTGDIFVYGKLDIDSLDTYEKTETVNGETQTNTYYSTDGEGYITANLYLYRLEKQLADNAKDASGNLYKKDSTTELAYLYEGDKYYVAVAGEGEDAGYTKGAETALADILASGNVNTKEVEVVLDGTEGKAPVITALTQNTAQAVSTLVYLDGNSVDNGDVAANGSSSMTGKMNIQFASSATLTPMNYAPLQGGSTGNNAGGEQQGGEQQGNP